MYIGVVQNSKLRTKLSHAATLAKESVLRAQLTYLYPTFDHRRP